MYCEYCYLPLQNESESISFITDVDGSRGSYKQTVTNISTPTAYRQPCVDKKNLSNVYTTHDTVVAYTDVDVSDFARY